MAHTLWFTGLSGSGKSTVAMDLYYNNPNYVVLDGDVLRRDLCSDLGFSVEDREENMRRLIALCKLYNKQGTNVITAFISPLEAWRVKAKEEIDNCYIIHANSSLEKCEERDVKGLYKKARAGEIPNFTGIDSPFEEPKCASLVLDTENEEPFETLCKLQNFVSGIERCYYTNVNPQDQHQLFIGRWTPLHKGHTWIIEQKMKEHPDRPILVLVRDTNFDAYSAEQRAEFVKAWFKAENIKGTIMIIPDIKGVYYGRGVGYDVDEIKPPDNIEGISATKIREMIANKDETWKDIVAPGVAPILEKLLS